MILAKLAKALRQQNWSAVVIEIIVVVVGILFALQVDNWNENRRERNLEQIYLQRLTADIQGDIDEFKELRHIFQEKFEFTEELKSGVTPEEIRRDPNSLVQRLRYSTFVSLPSVRSATFDELAGSGQLAIIRDLALRSALANYYAEYDVMSGILAQPVGNYKLLVYESFPGALLYAWRTSESITTWEQVLEGYENLYAQPGFEAAVNAEAGYAGDLVLSSDEFIGMGEDLQSMIAANVSDPVSP
jgi:hypothetical protein